MLFQASKVKTMIRKLNKKNIFVLALSVILFLTMQIEIGLAADVSNSG